MAQAAAVIGDAFVLVNTAGIGLNQEEGAQQEANGENTYRLSIAYHLASL